MPESIPSRGPEPVVLTFIYEVSDEWIEEQILETGERPAKHWELTVDLRDAASRVARRKLRAGHTASQVLDGLVELSEPTDDPLEIAEALVKAVDIDAQFSEEQYHAARSAWIAEHGSERLQLAHSRGYVVNRLYVVERIRAELPGFWVDTAGTADWKPRANPSAAALALETVVDEHLARLYGRGHSSIIVWMTRPPRDLQQHIDEADVIVDEQMEALLISDWLGRHVALLPVDVDLHAPHEEDEA